MADSGDDKLGLGEVLGLLVMCRNINRQLRLLSINHGIAIGVGVEDHVIQKLEELAEQLSDSARHQ